MIFSDVLIITAETEKIKDNNYTIPNGGRI